MPKIIKGNKILTSEPVIANALIIEQQIQNNENARIVWESYTGGKPYVIGNKVEYNGSSYICIQNATDKIPPNYPTYWQIIVAAGAGLTNATQLPIVDTGNYYTTDDTNSSLQEIAGRVGNLTNLETTSDTDLVSSINENVLKIKDIGINAKNFGAKGDGITDDSGAINAALAYVYSIGGGRVVLPNGQYYVSTKIVVPPKCTLMGFSLGSDVGGGNIQLVGSLSLPIVVELNGGAGSAQTFLKNISITRENGSIPSGSIGVQVNSTDYAGLENVVIFKHAIGLDLEGNLGCNCYQVIIYGVTEVYCIINNMPQPTFVNCSFGRNGGEYGLVANDVIQIKGQADTISFVRCQINPTVGGVTNAINFKGYDNVNGYIYFNTCHIENMTNIIVSDADTPLINRLIMNGCTVSGATTNPFVSLNINTAISEWVISNCIITGSTNLTNGYKLNMSNNRMAGLVVLSLLQANITGNIFYSGVILNGTWNNLVFANNLFDAVGQKITDNSSGKKNISGNVSTSGYSNPCILPDDYIKIGSGVSFGIREYTGILDSSGNASITHGLTNGHLKGLICQAFYKGGSEMLPMQILYIDGGSINVTGGIADRKYRVTLIFSENEDSNW